MYSMYSTRTNLFFFAHAIFLEKDESAKTTNLSHSTASQGRWLEDAFPEMPIVQAAVIQDRES